MREHELTEVPEKRDRKPNSRKSRKSPISTLIAQASIAWATRHADLLKPDVAVGMSHPAETMLRALLQLQSPILAMGNRKDIFDAWERRLNQRTSRVRVAAFNFGDVPFTARHYACTCQPPSSNHPALSEAAPVEATLQSAGGTAGLATLLTQQPGSEWWLMSQLLMKLVHGHLGWLPPSRMTSEYADAILDRVASRLKQRFAGLASVPNGADEAPVAGGLLAGLSWQPNGTTTVRSLQLPDCFDPQPDNEDRILGCAERAFAETPAREFADEHLPVVARLARDVAADLSTPRLSLQAVQQQFAYMARDEAGALLVQKAKEQFAYMASTYEHEHKRLRTWARSASSGKQAKAPPKAVQSRNIHPRFFLDELTPRAALLQSYSYWMADRGVDMVKDILQTVSGPDSTCNPTTTGVRP